MINHCEKGVNEVLINKHIDRCFHRHAHDAKGTKGHLELVTGEIDINEKLLLARNHDCRVVLEIKSIDGLKKTVKNLLGTL